MKVRRIIASVLTFMMLFMNVPTNVFAEDAVNIGNFELSSYSNIKEKIAECTWAKIESEDSTNNTIEIKLLNDIKGRLYFTCHDGTHVILNANEKTIDGEGQNEAICLENYTNVSLELIGNGTYIQGKNNSLFGYDIDLKSGTIKGHTYSFIKVSLEKKYDYYKIIYDQDNRYEGKKYTESQRVGVNTSGILKVTQHYANIKFKYNANGGSGTMADVIVDDDGEFTFPKCGYTAPNDKHFVGWQIEGDTNIYKIGDTKKFSLNDSGKILKAIWEKHTASDWIIDEEATSEKEGTKHKECTVCGRILETEKISKKESGTVEKKNDENITINNDVDHLSKNILTEQEVEKVKQGENAQIYVDVKDEVNKTDLEKVNASLNNYKLGKVYDISLWLKVGENTRQVTTTKEKLEMSLKVPEELINKDSKVKRTYKVMRLHEGKATLLDGTYDEKTQIITFETDQFSTYALVYNDTKVETPFTKEDSSDKKNNEVVDKDDKKEEVVNKDESTSSNQETVKPTVKKETKTTVKTENKTETKKVKTGDNSNSIFYMGLIGVSLLGIYCFVMKKFIH